jgi:hypothetical protein
MKTSGFKPANMDKIPASQIGLPPQSEGYDFEQGAAKLLNGVMTAGERVIFERALRIKAYAKSLEKISRPETLKEMWDSLVVNFRLKNAVPYAVREFVVEVTNPTPNYVGISQDYSLSIANEISFAKDKSTSVTHELSGKFSLSAGISTPGFDPIFKGADGKGGFPVELGAGLSGGYSYGGSMSWSTSNSTSTSARVSKGQNLSATAETFEIAVKTKKCLLFSGDPQDKRLKMPEGVEGYIVCAKGTESKTIQETYYLIDQAISTTVTRDGDSASASKWRMKVRGTESFNLFNSIISNPAIVLQFEQFSKEPDLTKLNPEFKVLQCYPGMVSIN